MIAILIIALWILYGMFAMSQSKEYFDRRVIEHTKASYENTRQGYYVGTGLLFIVFAPVILLIRMLYGGFKRYK